jgi:DNA replication and repair protein RecF
MPATPLPLFLRSLRLVDFRNYQTAALDLSPGLTLITGANGQGKSNLLEAIATLTLTKSPRAQIAGDLIRDGAGAAAVDGTIAKGHQELGISLRLYRESQTRTRRQSSVDGNGRSASEILGLAPTVLFWPDHLAIVKDGPEPRRRFLDTLQSQLSHRSAHDLLRYQKLLEQRNALLRQIRQGQGDLALLDAFTLRLAEIGATIQIDRSRLVTALAPLATAALNDLTSAADTLGLSYIPRGQPSTMPDEVAVATAELLDAFHSVRSEELVRGLTLIGPHRDHLDISLDGRPVSTHASQGQQRTILLALKLAELRYLAAGTDCTPILLLDDVLSELDAARRTAFLHLATTELGVQTLITSADPLDLPAATDLVRLTVTAGTVATS